jgi:hypothetical protein
VCVTQRGLRAIQHQGFVRIEREEGALGRGKACGRKVPVADVGDFPLAQVVLTVIFGQHHGVGLKLEKVSYGASWFALCRKGLF